MARSMPFDVRPMLPMLPHVQDKPLRAGADHPSMHNIRLCMPVFRHFHLLIPSVGATAPDCDIRKRQRHSGFQASSRGYLHPNSRGCESAGDLLHNLLRISNGGGAQSKWWWARRLDQHETFLSIKPPRTKLVSKQVTKKSHRESALLACLSNLIPGIRFSCGASRSPRL